MIYSTYVPVRVTYVTIVQVLLTDEKNTKRLTQPNKKTINEVAVHKLTTISVSDPDSSIPDPDQHFRLNTNQDPIRIQGFEFS